MKIKLTKGEIKTLNKDLKYCFKTRCERDVLEITDYFYECFVYDLRLWGHYEEIHVIDCFETLDTYKDLQETYQTLVYHHELYKKGKTPLDAFLGVCDGLSVDDLS